VLSSTTCAVNVHYVDETSVKKKFSLIGAQFGEEPFGCQCKDFHSRTQIAINYYSFFVKGS
jgi:hypothetical protein